MPVEQTARSGAFNNKFKKFAQAKSQENKQTPSFLSLAEIQLQAIQFRQSFLQNRFSKSPAGEYVIEEEKLTEAFQDIFSKGNFGREGKSFVDTKEWILTGKATFTRKNGITVDASFPSTIVSNIVSPLLQYAAAPELQDPNPFGCSNVFLGERAKMHVHGPDKKLLAEALVYAEESLRQDITGTISLSPEIKSQCIRIIQLGGGHIIGLQAADGIVNELSALQKQKSSDAQVLDIIQKGTDLFIAYVGIESTPARRNCKKSEQQRPTPPIDSAILPDKQETLNTNASFQKLLHIVCNHEISNDSLNPTEHARLKSLVGSDIDIYADIPVLNQQGNKAQDDIFETVVNQERATFIEIANDSTRFARALAKLQIIDTTLQDIENTRIALNTYLTSSDGQQFLQHADISKLTKVALRDVLTKIFNGHDVNRATTLLFADEKEIKTRNKNIPVKPEEAQRVKFAEIVHAILGLYIINFQPESAENSVHDKNKVHSIAFRVVNGQVVLDSCPTHTKDVLEKVSEDSNRSSQKVTQQRKNAQVRQTNKAEIKSPNANSNADRPRPAGFPQNPNKREQKPSTGSAKHSLENSASTASGRSRERAKKQAKEKTPSQGIKQPRTFFQELASKKVVVSESPERKKPETEKKEQIFYKETQSSHGQTLKQLKEYYQQLQETKDYDQATKVGIFITRLELQAQSQEPVMQQMPQGVFLKKSPDGKRHFTRIKNTANNHNTAAAIVTTGEPKTSNPLQTILASTFKIMTALSSHPQPKQQSLMQNALQATRGASMRIEQQQKVLVRETPNGIDPSEIRAYGKQTDRASEAHVTVGVSKKRAEIRTVKMRVNTQPTQVNSENISTLRGSPEYPATGVSSREQPQNNVSGISSSLQPEHISHNPIPTGQPTGAVSESKTSSAGSPGFPSSSERFSTTTNHETNGSSPTKDPSPQHFGDTITTSEHANQSRPETVIGSLLQDEAISDAQTKIAASEALQKLQDTTYSSEKKQEQAPAQQAVGANEQAKATDQKQEEHAGESSTKGHEQTTHSNAGRAVRQEGETEFTTDAQGETVGSRTLHTSGTVTNHQENRNEEQADGQEAGTQTSNAQEETVHVDPLRVHAERGINAQPAGQQNQKSTITQHKKITTKQSNYQTLSLAIEAPGGKITDIRVVKENLRTGLLKRKIKARIIIPSIAPQSKRTEYPSSENIMQYVEHYASLIEENGNISGVWKRVKINGNGKRKIVLSFGVGKNSSEARYNAKSENATLMI